MGGQRRKRGAPTFLELAPLYRVDVGGQEPWPPPAPTVESCQCLQPRGKEKQVGEQQLHFLLKLLLK